MENSDFRMLGRDPIESVRGSVAAAIIHEQNLEGAPQALEFLEEFLDQHAEVIALVVNRNQDREQRVQGGTPGTWIGRAGSVRRSVPVHVRPSGPPGSEDAVPGRLAAAGVTAPDARMSFGQCIFHFPRDVPASDVVRFSLDAMRALGAEPADGRWEWAVTVEIDTTGPAGS